MCLCVSTPITTRRRRGLSCMLVMLLIPSFDRTDDATLAGRVDGTVTRLRQSGSYEVTARPASTTGGAPAGRRQINSKDTQTGGVSRKQESGRLPTPNILTVEGRRNSADRGLDARQGESFAVGQGRVLRSVVMVLNEAGQVSAAVASAGPDGQI